MRIPRTLAIIGCLLMVHAAFSGTIDSVEARLRTEGRTTTRVDLLIRKAMQHINDPELDVSPIWKEAHQLAEELKYERGLAYAPMGPAVERWHAGEHAAAIDSMKTCIARLDVLGVDQDFHSALGWLREVYSSAGMQHERLRYYTDAVDRYRKGPLRMSLGTSYHALAGYYMRIRQYGAAIEHYIRARECFPTRPDIACNETMVIGWAYEQWGNPARAIPFIQEALPCLTAQGDTGLLADCHMRLATDRLALGDTLGALRDLERSRSLLANLDSSNPLFRSKYIPMLVQLGRIEEAGIQYARMIQECQREEVPLNSFNGACEPDYCGYILYSATGRLAQADSSLREALTKALRINDLPLVLRYRKALMERLWTSGDAAGSAREAALYVRMNDSLQAVANADAVAAYEGLVKERESALEIQRQQARVKQQRVVLLGIAVVLLLLAALAWSVYKGKKRSDELLLNILPAEVAKELKATGASAARHIEQATILFTDFKGFTEASELLTPQELVEELDTCFKAFDAIITARGIEKIKTIGDAYMAAGGLPRKVTSGVGDVVQAALDMQAFMLKRKAERTALGRPAFDMRVGVHTGPVVAGIVGVKKFQYDIWGDTVNTASRMESSGEVGRVNISESTYREIAAQPGWVFTPRGKVQAKGKGELEMYFVQPN